MNILSRGSFALISEREDYPWSSVGVTRAGAVVTTSLLPAGLASPDALSPYIRVTAARAFCYRHAHNQWAFVLPPGYYYPVMLNTFTGAQTRTNYWVAAKPKCCNSHWLNRLSGLLLTTEIHYINCNNSFLRSQGKRSRSQKIVTNISSHLSSLSHFRTFTPVTPLKLVWNLKHTCMGQLYCYNVLLHTKMVHALQCGHGRHFNRPTWNIEIPI